MLKHVTLKFEHVTYELGQCRAIMLSAPYRRREIDRQEGFGNWFREDCREAGCPGSAHGLRKAGATRAAENGTTVNQLMALFGWKTERMALHYTRKADRKRLAAAAAPLLLAQSANASSLARTTNDNRPHLGSGAGASANDQAKSGGQKLDGAQERTRTSTAFNHWYLKPARLPIPPPGPVTPIGKAGAFALSNAA